MAEQLDFAFEIFDPIDSTMVSNHFMYILKTHFNN